jgi:hypothetical protein
MADYVRARLTAAKVGVGLAITGVLAGVVERVRPQQPPGPMSPSASHQDAAQVHAATLTQQLKNKIGSSQIKDHSLLYKDFKQGQVLSYKELKNIKILDNETTGLQSSFKLLKADILSVLGSIYTKVQADATFLAKTDTAVNAAKVNGLSSSDFVNGHGNVFSGVQHLAVGDPAQTLFTIPNEITVQGNYPSAGNPEVDIFNLTNAPVAISWLNAGENRDTIPVGTSGYPLLLNSDSPLVTAQLLTGDGHPMTLTFSFSPDQTGDKGRFVGQALAAPAP